LWDAFTNEEACGFVQERLHEPHHGAKSIVLQAYYRGSVDNIAVMVVNFANNTVAETLPDDVDFEDMDLIDDVIEL